MIHPIACIEQRCSCHSHNGFLTRRGHESLAEAARLQYLDKVVSVSGLIEIENDFEYDPNHIELNEIIVHPQGG